MPEISVLIEGGKATASAPLGPALGPLGVNIGEIVNQINEKTKGYAGVKVPVKVIVDSSTKEFEIKVGSPPMSALVKKELGLEKGAANPKTDVVANLSIEQAKKIARVKINALTSTDLKSAVKEVIGTCDSMGITVDGKKARQVQEEIGGGKYDAALAVAAAEGFKEEIKDVAEGLGEAAEDLVEEKEEIKGDIGEAVEGVAENIEKIKGKAEQPASEEAKAEEKPKEEKKAEEKKEAGAKPEEKAEEAQK